MLSKVPGSERNKSTFMTGRWVAQTADWKRMLLPFQRFSAYNITDTISQEIKLFAPTCAQVENQMPISPVLYEVRLRLSDIRH